MKNTKAVALAVVAFSAGTFTTAWSATTATQRYTPHYQHVLKAHSCVEDEYMFIPSTRVNDKVRYNTPAYPLCVHIDNVRRADAR